ncbi:hypothetical protein F511_39278 [Dorcoceras hygrometricum]|uniref:Uncharacterized protein n=1 Tax=Dorcoceras hygrometricum TaxID=472368 RepID=A0A2Z7CEY7_9LAMI|nr:hypothetical protein F511_39278 [Dorcoceras hygrometricum]
MRSVVASHGPGSNPRGPNQTLEEISRHDIAGASTERRPSQRKTCAAQKATHGRDKRGSASPMAAHGNAPLASLSRNQCAKGQKAVGQRVQQFAQHHRPPCAFHRGGSSCNDASARRGATACAEWRPPLGIESRPARNEVHAAAGHGRPPCAASMASRALWRARWAAARGGGRPPALEGLTRSARMDSPRQVGRNKFRRLEAAVAVAVAALGGGGGLFREEGAATFRYGPFNPYIPIRSTTIGKSRVAIDPIAMHTSWRSNSDITSVTSIGYPRMSASGESSTTMHRLLHASGSHPIPPPDDPKSLFGCFVSIFGSDFTFRAFLEVFVFLRFWVKSGFVVGAGFVVRAG